MPVNPNEAPEGFVAAQSAYGSCIGCAFIDDYCRSESHPASGFSCLNEERADGEEVIFVVRSDPDPQPATANYPCDDMGTPV